MTDSTWFVVKRAAMILNKRDRQKLLSLTLIHAFLGLLDICAVLILGLLGSLAITGVSSNQPGNRVQRFIEIIGLSESDLQTQVAALGLISAALLVFRSIISLFLSRKVLYFLGRKSALITSSLLKRLLSEDLLTINVKKIHELIFALTTGVNAVAGNLLGASAILAADLFLIFAFSISLFFVDPYVAMSSLLLFSGVAFALYRVMHGRAQELGSIVTEMTIDSNQKIFEVISSYRELLVKNRREHYASRISALRLRWSNSLAEITFLSFLSKYIIELSMVIGGLSVAAIQFMINPASRAVAVISIFLVSSARIAPAALRIQSGLITIRNNIGVAKPTLDIIEQYAQDYVEDHISESEIAFNFKNYDDFKPEISINIDSFKYPGSNSMNLKNVSIKIGAGEFIGVTGESGAGKTTLVDLILGVLNPTEGSISISGFAPINAFNKWPGAVAYVSQETKLINGSLKDNVCLGFEPKDFTDEYIESLLEQVDLGELLGESEGVNVKVGEGGKSLSGGQKQRLGIARALVTNPKLIILDESTSALDATTEKKVMKMLGNYKGTRTIIMITHRLAAIKGACRIIYIEKGEVKGFDSFVNLRSKFESFNELAKNAGV